MNGRLREALNQLLGLIDNEILVFNKSLEPSDISQAQHHIDKAVEAYEEPPRNCDRFDGDIEKLREACLRERGLNPDEDFPEIFCEWLLATAEKGANDGVC